ncbi:MAG: hypothetical protein H7Z40_21760 [Phycisphaerae bacterium]|nr:hypothetical protein [Gemmatimonadaceae bacterium]
MAGWYAMLTEVRATDNIQVPQKTLSRTSGFRQRSALLALVIAVVAAAGCSGAMPTPGRDVNQGQMMLDLTEALNSIRDQSASLQDQVDSLRDVVVRQDTVLRQLALNAGIPMPVAK